MSDYYVYDGRLYSSDELRHHGILGMKWGVRRYQNPDGSLTDAGKRRYSGDEGTVKRAKDNAKIAKKEYHRAFNKAYNYTHRHPISQFTSNAKSKKSEDLWEKAIDAAEKSKNAKKDYKSEKQKYTEKNVKAYSKQMDKAINLANKRDALYKEAKKQYQDLGNNWFERFKASYKDESPAAKKYNKTWEKASTMDDDAFDALNKAKEMYKKTGRSYVTRALNNMKYDPI